MQRRISLNSYTDKDLALKIDEILDEGWFVDFIFDCGKSYVSGSDEEYLNCILLVSKPIEINMETSKEVKKPTLGVMPRYLHDEARYLELCRAISERFNAGQEIRFEWIEEYNELINKLKRYGCSKG